MSRKTLLLNTTYEVMNFIGEKKVVKLLVKENKVEIIANWDEDIVWGSGRMKHPSILKLKNHVKRNYFNSNFSRPAIVKRDRSTCVYCNTKLSKSQVTIDHVLPRVQGGTTSFTNCVVSCHDCNNKKAGQTPEQAGMVLLRRPVHPSFCANAHLNDNQQYWHSEWDYFLVVN